MPLKKTKIFCLFSLLIALLFATTFWILYTFTSTQIANTISASDQLTVEIKKEETMSFMKHDIQTGEQYQNQIYQYAVGKDGVVDFLKILDILVASSSVTSQVNSVNYQNTDALTAISAELMDVNMSVIGTWNQVLYFEKLLENYPLKIGIKKVSFEKYTDYTVRGKIVPQWSVTIDFTVVKLQ